MLVNILIHKYNNESIYIIIQSSYTKEFIVLDNQKFDKGY